MRGTYDPWLVTLSMAVAVMASYVALDLASRVTASAGRTARYWLASGAVSMGLGIWSMHFIAMLAFRLPMPMTYNVPITLFSLVIAMLASALALHTASREHVSWRRLGLGGVLMGIGIAAMHYTGMAAMQMDPPLRYHPGLFALSIVVAIVVSLVALWIAFRLREETILSGFWRKAGSAVLMGAAICGMHYTGMAATIFSPHSMPTAGEPGMDSFWLALTIGAFTVTLLATTLLVSISDTRRAREAGEHRRHSENLRQSHDELEIRVRERTAELALINTALEAEIAERGRTEQALRFSEDEAREIINTAYDAYVGMDANSRILDWNQKSEQTFGWTRAEVLGRNLAELIIPQQYREAHARGVAHFMASGEGPVLNKRIEITALHRDGYEFPVELTIWPVRIGDTYKFNAFLHDIGERRQRIRRLAAQTAAAAALVEAGSVADAAAKVLDAVGAALEWSVGALWTVDGDAHALRCIEFWNGPGISVPAFEQITRSMTFAPDVGLPGRVWSSGKPLWIADVTTDSNFPRAKFAAEGGLHAAFGFPIISGTRVLGVAEFFSSAIQQPDTELLRMMDTLGNLLGQFIERKQAQGALADKEQRLAEAQQIAHVGSWEWDVATNKLVWSDELFRIYRLDPREFVPTIETFFQNVHPEDRQLVRDTMENAYRHQQPFRFEHRIVRPEGSIGVLQGQGQVKVDARGRTCALVGTCQDITDIREAEQHMRRLAHFDSLTGLPNRREFYESLRKAMALADAEAWLIPVLFLDLDRFKNVNDTLGHVIGDELLREVATRLLGCLRMRDTVGRLGGDEFGLILVTPPDPQIAAKVANKALAEIRKPFLLEGREVSMSASIGITVYPTDARDIDTLIKFADTAMYEAKESGRDTFRFYTAEMNARAMDRVELDTALRRARERSEFMLHYQPKISLADGRWTGSEALLRWQRPDHGLVPPAEFIPALEDSGLIMQVGSWVIDAACRQIAEWRSQGISTPGIAVNVSGRQVLRGPLNRDELAHLGMQHASVDESQELELELARALQEHAIGPELLELELTESTLMLHADRTVNLLHRLKAQGIRISIDDFGTGYSSLSYLQRFPIDTVKIDRGFVRDITSNPDDAAIATAIIQMAHSLKLKVIAEGVETREQLELLCNLGCDEAQGYYIARPMPAADLAALFQAGAGPSHIMGQTCISPRA